MADKCNASSLECQGQGVDHFLSTGSIGLAVLVLTLGVYLVKKASPSMSKRRKLPPHVPSLPLLGSVLFMDRKRPHVTLTEWREKYGDIYTIRVLREPVVVLNSVEMIREALCNKSEAFAGRPLIYRINYGFHGASDIIFGTYTPKWQYMKKIASKGLRQFGLGSSEIDKVVEEEMEALVTAFSQNSTDPFDPRLTLMTAVVNAITAAMTGKRYDHKDPRMLQYQQTTRLFSESCSCVEGMELDLFPWLRHLPVVNNSFKKLTIARDMLDELVDAELEEARGKFETDNVRCILDVLFKAQEDGDNGNEKFEITDDDIRSIFIDLLVSGTFTTSIALSCFVLLISQNRNLQRELRAELDRHIGRRRLPTGTDRQKMHKMEATILEILRYISHVPLNLPHYSTEEVEIGGYHIPAGTQVLTNLWSLHHDPRYWDSPWTFNPKRFIGFDAKLLPSHDEKRRCLMPFGAGKRMCLGDSLARERLFLFATILLQKFDFQPAGGTTMQSCDPRDFDLGLILEPKPFQVKVTSRSLLRQMSSMDFGL